MAFSITLEKIPEDKCDTPNIATNQQNPTHENESKELGKNGVIIISGGSNDLDKNSEKISEVLPQTIKFSQIHSNSKIIITKIPHRHDLHKYSKTNLAIKKFNMKLNNIMQRFRHVTLIDTDLCRENNTKHGMHLNNKGKDEIARKMAKLINKVVIDEKKDTII